MPWMFVSNHFFWWTERAQSTDKMVPKFSSWWKSKYWCGQNACGPDGGFFLFTPTFFLYRSHYNELLHIVGFFGFPPHCIYAIGARSFLRWISGSPHCPSCKEWERHTCPAEDDTHSIAMGLGIAHVAAWPIQIHGRSTWHSLLRSPALPPSSTKEIWYPKDNFRDPVEEAALSGGSSIPIISPPLSRDKKKSHFLYITFRRRDFRLNEIQISASMIL